MEEWRPVKGYEGKYEVSNHGRVRSVERTVPSCITGGNFIPQKILTPYIHFRGYLKINLYSGKGEHKRYFVHRLVAIAFIPNPENKPIVNHKDLNKENPRVENLEWVDESENQHHWRGERSRVEASNKDF